MNTMLDAATARRLVDLVVATLLAALVLPVAVLIALATLLEVGHPILFRQRRTGKDGAEFSIVKFRTLRAEAYPGEPDLDRQSRVGAFLRRSGLDEIPQLWNVLAGEMAFIGPRPTLPDQVARYDDRQRGRLAVLPGITGWAQVNGRNSVSWPDRIELDLWYIEHRSPALDVRIVARTAVAMLRPTGVVGEGGVNPDFPGASPPPGPDSVVVRPDDGEPAAGTLRPASPVTAPTPPPPEIPAAAGFA